MQEFADDTGRSVYRRSVRQNAAFGIALLAEYLLLSSSFDAQPVIIRGGVWALFSYVGSIGLVIMLIGVVAVFLGSIRSRCTARPNPNIQLLVWHVVAYAIWFGVTWLTLGYSEPPPGPAAIWILSWLLAGVLSVGTLLASLWQFRVDKPKLVASSLVSAGVLGMVAWQAGLLTQRLWLHMAELTLNTTAAVLRAVYPHQDLGHEAGAVLRLADFAVRIDVACSGFEGMGLATILIAAYWIAFRRELRFPHAFLLLPIGVLLVWVGNVLRIVALMSLGAFVDPHLAIGAFHSKAGWVAFCAIALAVGALGRSLRFFSRGQRDASDSALNPTAAYVLPLVILVATALATSMFAVTYDRFYVLRLVSAAIVLVAYRRHYGAPSWAWSWPPCLFGAAFGLLWVVTQARNSNLSQLEVAGQHAGFGWLTARALGSVVIIPVCEELAFRGFLMRWLVSRDFTHVATNRAFPMAVAISSVAFGLLHQRWCIASFAGVGFALVQIRSGKLGDSIVAHGVTNAIIAIWVLMSEDFSSWA